VYAEDPRTFLPVGVENDGGPWFRRIG
jgi:hypothetical protein